MVSFRLWLGVLRGIMAQTKGMAEMLSAQQRKDLEGKLGERLRHDINVCRELGYVPTGFIGMISKQGAVGACISVVVASRIPDGFLKIFELGRLDLSVERTVLDGPWRVLFSDEVIAAAKKRLRQYGRPDLIV